MFLNKKLHRFIILLSKYVFKIHYDKTSQLKMQYKNSIVVLTSCFGYKGDSFASK